MPTYEYRCKACGQELEVVQSFTDDALTTCEACGGQLRKVFGNVGIAFKGSGFYKNDSRGKSTTAAPPAPTRAQRRGSSSATTARRGDVGRVELRATGRGGSKKEPAASAPSKSDTSTRARRPPEPLPTPAGPPLASAAASPG